MCLCVRGCWPKERVVVAAAAAAYLDAIETYTNYRCSVFRILQTPEQINQCTHVCMCFDEQMVKKKNKLNSKITFTLSQNKTKHQIKSRVNHTSLRYNTEIPEQTITTKQRTKLNLVISFFLALYHV